MRTLLSAALLAPALGLVAPARRRSSRGATRRLAFDAAPLFDCDGVIVCDAPDVPSLGSFAAERARRSFADTNVLGGEAAAPDRLVDRETDASAADDSPSAAPSV